MLQINTGKLFSTPTSQENQLKGVLYTNVQFPRGGVETVAGSLYSTSELAGYPKMLIYDFIERIESGGPGGDVLISHGADFFLDEMGALVSFGLNCTCSQDFELVRRLTSGQRGLLTRYSPSDFIKQAYDQGRFVKADELDNFALFVRQLLGLHRRNYLAVMRAIKTYVVAMHRVADDLELAYTLLVAAGESLVQQFDGHEADWGAMEAGKRKAFDHALEGGDAQLIEAVQSVVLQYEHQALARRFREFVSTHLSQDFFNRGLTRGECPIGRGDLPELLREAYGARSKYVHELARLHQNLTLGGHAEMVSCGGAVQLSLQGLSSLIRRVISDFIFSLPTVDEEPCHYAAEIPSIVTVDLSPEIWVWRVSGDICGQGLDRLKGFLELFERVLFRQCEFPGMECLVKWIVDNCQRLTSHNRHAYVAIYRICTFLCPNPGWPTSPALERLLDGGLRDCTPIGLLVSSIVECELRWSVTDAERALQKYQQERHTKHGIRVPRIFEAGMALFIAEAHRKSGQLSECWLLLCQAVDNYPENIELRDFVKSFDEAVPIELKKALLPNMEESGVEIRE